MVKDNTALLSYTSGGKESTLDFAGLKSRIGRCGEALGDSTVVSLPAS